MSMYNDNPRVKRYIDRFCKTENKSVQEALDTAIVKSYIDYVKNNASEASLPNMWGSAGAAHDNVTGG